MVRSYCHQRKDNLEIISQFKNGKNSLDRRHGGTADDGPHADEDSND